MQSRDSPPRNSSLVPRQLSDYEEDLVRQLVDAKDVGSVLQGLRDDHRKRILHAIDNRVVPQLYNPPPPSQRTLGGGEGAITNHNTTSGSRNVSMMSPSFEDDDNDMERPGTPTPSSIPMAEAEELSQLAAQPAAARRSSAQGKAGARRGNTATSHTEGKGAKNHHANGNSKKSGDPALNPATSLLVFGTEAGGGGEYLQPHKYTVGNSSSNISVRNNYRQQQLRRNYEQLLSIASPKRSQDAASGRNDKLPSNGKAVEEDPFVLHAPFGYTQHHAASDSSPHHTSGGAPSGPTATRHHPIGGFNNSVVAGVDEGDALSSNKSSVSGDDNDYGEGNGESLVVEQKQHVRSSANSAGIGKWRGSHLTLPTSSEGGHNNAAGDSMESRLHLGDPTVTSTSIGGGDYFELTLVGDQSPSMSPPPATAPLPAVHHAKKSKRKASGISSGAKEGAKNATVKNTTAPAVAVKPVKVALAKFEKAGEKVVTPRAGTAAPTAAAAPSVTPLASQPPAVVAAENSNSNNKNTAPAAANDSDSDGSYESTSGSYSYSYSYSYTTDGSSSEEEESHGRRQLSAINSAVQYRAGSDVPRAAAGGNLSARFPVAANNNSARAAPTSQTVRPLQQQRAQSTLSQSRSSIHQIQLQEFLLKHPKVATTFKQAAAPHQQQQQLQNRQQQQQPAGSMNLPRGVPASQLHLYVASGPKQAAAAPQQQQPAKQQPAPALQQKQSYHAFSASSGKLTRQQPAPQQPAPAPQPARSVMLHPYFPYAIPVEDLPRRQSVETPQPNAAATTTTPMTSSISSIVPAGATAAPLGASQTSTLGSSPTAPHQMKSQDARYVWKSSEKEYIPPPMPQGVVASTRFVYDHRASEMQTRTASVDTPSPRFVNPK